MSPLLHRTPGCSGLWYRTLGTYANGRRALVCGQCHRTHPTSNENLSAAADANTLHLQAEGIGPLEAALRARDALRQRPQTQEMVE